MIKVSVILTTYNCSKYLRQSIDSILNQTLKEIELICVDDRSTDNSADIVREYIEVDSRVSLIVMTKNTGNAATPRNNGIKVAKGEYLSILDGDDNFELEMLEEMYNKAMKDKADVVVCSAVMIYEDTNRKDKIVPRGINSEMHHFFNENDTFVPSEYPDYALFANPTEAAWTLLVKRNFCLDNQLSFCMSYSPFYAIDDNNFSFLSLICASRISFVWKQFVTYRRLHGSGQYNKKFEYIALNTIDVLLRLADDLYKRSIYETFSRGVLNKLLYKIIYHMTLITDPELFNLTFIEFKTKVIGFLLSDNLNEEYFFIQNLYEMLKDINNHDALGYLLNIHNNKKNMHSKRKEILDFLTGKTVILYGFGQIGKSWFRTIMEDERINIIIVDSNPQYEFIKTPDEAVKNCLFDFVLVCVESYTHYNEIQNILLRLGVIENKIIWSESNDISMKIEDVGDVYV